ncbi:MAG: DUF4215 domain-containing protein [Sandaracinaceae bacterium]|nr:DUF4215 domain-containing protein [Sandaracinaceae bacterium]
MAQQLRIQTLSTTALAALLALTSGCQLVVGFDRDRIPSDGGGMDSQVEADTGPPDGGPPDGGPVCGDGVLAGTEACDDGDTTAGDGCSDTCTVEDGWDCNTASPTVCTETCGDNMVVGTEECDDGMDGDDDDGCTDTCELTCEADVDCSDDDVCNGDEVCDTGTHTCGAGTAPADGTSCGAGAEVCFGGACITPVCGNTVVEPGEQCDDGMNGDDTDGCTDACRRTCTMDSDCDDGEPCNGDETCDTTASLCEDGTALANGVSCGSGSEVCFMEVCITPMCGNGVVEPGETCDDNNALACGGCNATCGGAGTGRCDDGTGCAVDNDCSSGFCDATSDQCTACTGDADCSGSPLGGQCVGGDCATCDPTDDAGCTGGDVCHSTMLTCVECESNGDCSGGTPFCSASNVCVECLGASDCNDSNECTTDSCTGGSCSTAPRDGLACTGGLLRRDGLLHGVRDLRRRVQRRDDDGELRDRRRGVHELRRRQPVHDGLVRRRLVLERVAGRHVVPERDVRRHDVLHGVRDLRRRVQRRDDDGELRDGRRGVHELRRRQPVHDGLVRERFVLERVAGRDVVPERDVRRHVVLHGLRDLWRRVRRRDHHGELRCGGRGVHELRRQQRVHDGLVRERLVLERIA